MSSVERMDFFFFCLQSCVTKIFLHAEAQGTEPSHLERERERGEGMKKKRYQEL